MLHFKWTEPWELETQSLNFWEQFRKWCKAKVLQSKGMPKKTKKPFDECGFTARWSFSIRRTQTDKWVVSSSGRVLRVAVTHSCTRAAPIQCPRGRRFLAKPQFVAWSDAFPFLCVSTFQGSAAAVFSSAGLKGLLHLATQHVNHHQGLHSLPDSVFKGSSEGSVKSGEKAANRWAQVWWQTGMSSMCYSVKMKRSHSPQSHPGVFAPADNLGSKKERLPWLAPHEKSNFSQWTVNSGAFWKYRRHPPFFNIALRLDINFKYIKTISAWGCDSRQSRHRCWHLWPITSRHVRVRNAWKEGNNKFSAAPSAAGTFRCISSDGPSLLISLNLS